MEKDFVCGMISGISQTIIGHPFDTIKVRAQCGVSTPLKPILYFNGVSYNLLSSIACNAIVFGVHGNTSQIYKEYHESIVEDFIPGFISGICVTPFVFLFDIGKNKKQTLGKKLQLSDLLQTRGAFTTLVREPIAFSIYFSTYKHLKEKRDYPVFLAGGASGVACWAFTYPLDVLRNRQITYNMTLRDAVSAGKLMNGFGVCVFRAFLVNSFGFYFYEKSKDIYEYIIK